MNKQYIGESGRTIEDWETAIERSSKGDDLTAGVANKLTVTANDCYWCAACSVGKDTIPCAESSLCVPHKELMSCYEKTLSLADEPFDLDTLNRDYIQASYDVYNERTKQCACKSIDASECAMIRYQSEFSGEPCECICHEGKND